MEGCEEHSAEVGTLVNTILDAESALERLTAAGRRARLLVEKKYSREYVVGLYKRLFDGMNEDANR